jgi:hypothetical protein
LDVGTGIIAAVLVMLPYDAGITTAPTTTTDEGVQIAGGGSVNKLSMSSLPVVLAPPP